MNATPAPIQRTYVTNRNENNDYYDISAKTFCQLLLALGTKLLRSIQACLPTQTLNDEHWQQLTMPREQTL